MSEDFNFNIPEEYRPISMWGYLGYQLLFAIPCAGFILILVFAFGGAKNKNVRNFARSYLCLWLLIFVLYLLIFLLFGGSAFMQYMQYMQKMS